MNDLGVAEAAKHLKPTPEQIKQDTIDYIRESDVLLDISRQLEDIRKRLPNPCSLEPLPLPYLRDMFIFCARVILFVAVTTFLIGFGVLDTTTRVEVVPNDYGPSIGSCYKHYSTYNEYDSLVSKVIDYRDGYVKTQIFYSFMGGWFDSLGTSESRLYTKEGIVTCPSTIWDFKQWRL